MKGLNPMPIMSKTNPHSTDRPAGSTRHGMVASWACRWAPLLPAQAGMRAAPSQAAGAAEKAQRPGPHRFLRLERILVPVDFSESSVDALRFALPFAREFGARLDLLHVIEPAAAAFGQPGEGGYLPFEGSEQRQRSASARLERLAAAEVRQPVQVTVLVKEGRPRSVIGAVAAELRSNLLVVSTQGRTGLKQFLLGSTAEAVVRRAPCPVLTVRRRFLARRGTPQSPPSERINRILVPVDFSASSRAMLQYAVAFATQCRASVMLLHVVDRICVPSRIVYYATRLQMVFLERGLRELAELARRLPDDIKSEQMVRSGTPYDVIVQVARREQVDLIIIATRGHGAVKRFFIGGTAGRVVRHAPCPVLVVR